MYSFHLTTRILMNQKKIDVSLFNFLLRGNTSLDPAKTPKPPTLNWMSEQSWKDAELLSTLNSKFNSLLNDITTNEEYWKQWYD